MKGDVVGDVDGAFGLSDKVDVDGLGFRDGREGREGEDEDVNVDVDVDVDGVETAGS